MEDSHKAQMLKLQEVNNTPFDLAKSTEDEEVAISVQGDTTNHYAAPQSQSGGAMKLLAGVLAGAALPLAGLAAYEWFNEKQSSTAVVAPTDRDTYVPYDFGIE